MSLEQHAFLNRQRVPSREQWQNAIDDLGFSFSLDPELKPNEDSGFLPCRLNGNPGGFEISYEPAADYLDAYPELGRIIGDRDWCISFRWGGDMAECACVLIACAALIDCAEAVIYYPDDEMVYDRQSLIGDAHDCLSEL